MKPHYSEADLLETYYTQPGESMPVMMHLADCEECAARYERLERKLRTMSGEDCGKPETFWARQRISVMHTIERRAARWPMIRVAAAAAVVLVTGGILTVNRVERTPAPVSVATAATAPATAATAGAANAETAATTTADPWQSDQLKEFQSIVAWESWVDDSRAGDQTL